MLTANQIKQFASLKQKKYRLEHSRYLIEGFHLIEECLKSQHELEYIILREGADLQGHAEILKMISQNKTIVEPLPVKQFNKLIETESSQGIVGVVKRPAYGSAIPGGNIIIALDKVSDPGNLGTIIRTAYWFGVKDIILSEDCADPYNPKVIRSTQGGVFHVNLFEDTELAAELKKLKQDNYKIYLFALESEKFLEQIPGNNKSVLVFGSESRGISNDLLNEGFETVKIKGNSDSESLNVAISAGIALHHFTK